MVTDSQFRKSIPREIRMGPTPKESSGPDPVS